MIAMQALGLIFYDFEIDVRFWLELLQFVCSFFLSVLSDYGVRLFRGAVLHVILFKEKENAVTIAFEYGNGKKFNSK